MIFVCTQSNFSSAWHDNQFFFFFYSFIFSFFVNSLLWATLHVVDGLPAWSISSHVMIVLKRLTFGSRLLVLFLLRGKIWLKSIIEKMGDFWSMRLEASIKVISERHDLGTYVFSDWIGLAGSKLVASLDAYQITNYQFPSKIHFLLLDFRRIRERVSKSRIFSLFFP